MWIILLRDHRYKPRNFQIEEIDICKLQIWVSQKLVVGASSTLRYNIKLGCQLDII